MGQLHKSALLEVSRTMLWRQLQHWAIEPAQLGLSSGHQLVLGAKEAKVPANIIAQRSSQSYSEAMPGGRYSPSPSELASGEGRHRVSEFGANSFHFPHPSHTSLGAGRDAGLTRSVWHLAIHSNHGILELGPFLQWVVRRQYKRLIWRSFPSTVILIVPTARDPHCFLPGSRMKWF